MARRRPPHGQRRRSAPRRSSSPIPSWFLCSTATRWSVDGGPDRGDFEGAGLAYQSILVNDGSRDRSREVIADARTNPYVLALNLLQNYGQHHANLAGLREATGDYVITMDDDLQNPPDQALLLIDEAIRLPRCRLREVRAQAGRRATAGSAAR